MTRLLRTLTSSTARWTRNGALWTVGVGGGGAVGRRDVEDGARKVGMFFVHEVLEIFVIDWC